MPAAAVIQLVLKCLFGSCILSKSLSAFSSGMDCQIIAFCGGFLSNFEWTKIRYLVTFERVG